MAEKYDIKGPHDYLPEEREPAPFPEIQPAWKIPGKVVIQAAISGGGHLNNKANPHFPANLDDIRDEAEECIQAGASGVHFDHDYWQCKTRDGKTLRMGESYGYIINPLLEKYGRAKLLPNCNILRGETYEEQLTTVYNGISEISYLNPSNSPRWLVTTMGILLEHGCRPELVIHEPSKIDLADRIFLRDGLLPKPRMYIILAGSSLQSPSRRHMFMPNERAMAEGLLLLVNRIRDVDSDDPFIIVCASGRSSRYLTTFAMLLGLHVRVGMEDTVWKYPHRQDLVKSNAEEVREAIQIARLLGREVATPDEYREMVGLKPR